MGPTLSGFLTAGFLLGQTGGGNTQYISPPSAGSAYGNYGSTQSVIVQPDGSTGTPRRGLFSRMQGWFRRDPQPQPSYQYPQNGSVMPNGTVIMQNQPTRIAPGPIQSTTPPITTVPAQPTGEYPRRMPSSSMGPRVPATEAIVGAAGVMPVTGSPVVANKMQPSQPTPLTPANANKVGRDDKFAWITGQLEIENGQSVLYYATPETVDQYHGRLVLQTQADMSKFRRGDLVTAEGHLVQRPGLRGATAVYRAEHVNLVEALKR